MSPSCLRRPAQGKQVLLPAAIKNTHVITPVSFTWQAVKAGAFGMRMEPAGEAAVPQIIICPMLAFNRGHTAPGATEQAGHDRLRLPAAPPCSSEATFAAQEHDFTPKAHDACNCIFTRRKTI